MTERKWTPGPWVKRGDTCTVQGPQGNTVADVRYKNGRNDAHLIAAAPDLYEALGNMAALAEPYMRDEAQMIGIKAARDALAKARGDVTNDN